MSRACVCMCPVHVCVCVCVCVCVGVWVFVVQLVDTNGQGRVTSATSDDVCHKGPFLLCLVEERVVGDCSPEGAMVLV